MTTWRPVLKMKDGSSPVRPEGAAEGQFHAMDHDPFYVIA